MDINEIELISNEANDVLNKPPSWIFKWGMLAVALTGVSVLVLAGIIPYTEKVVLPVAIGADHQPVPVIAPYPGTLAAVHFRNGMLVRKDTLLATLATGNGPQRITAPVSGYVSLYKQTANVQQFIRRQDTLCYIIPVPGKKGAVIYTGAVMDADAHKIKPGAPVSLQFGHHYPALEGRIRELSLVPGSNGERTVFIALPDTLHAKTGALPFYAYLVKGKAAIIISRKKIIHKLLQR